MGRPFYRLRWRNSWSGAETFNYDGTHRLTSINGPSGTRWYGHDARGNVTGRPGFTHIFDAANRLTETPGIGRFEYDGHGRRTVTWRVDGTAKVDFYTVDGKVRYKTDNREGGGTDYVYLGDQLVAEHKGPWRSTRGTIYTHTDHLGSPIVRTNNLAHVYSRDRRTNFGAPLTLNPVEAEAGYTGHIEDPEQGLVYMQQRYYDPAIARFLSVDPVGPLQNPSLAFGRYHYGNNNPYRYTDPDGRWAEDLILGVPSVALGAKSLYDNLAAGNIGGAIADGAGIVADIAAIAAPGIPGGAGLAIQAGRAADAGATSLRADTIGEGTTVFRVFGENNNPMGESWTTVDPSSVENFREVAGLPDVNTGRFVIEGTISNMDDVSTRAALPLDGNPGGINEVVIPNATDRVRIKSVSGANPEF